VLAACTVVADAGAGAGGLPHERLLERLVLRRRRQLERLLCGG
jgi:hypothetical protein